MASCSFGADQRVATQEVSRFHDLYNTENYSAIYTAADNALRTATSESDYLALMAAVHRKLGLFKSSTDLGWRVSTTFNGTEVALAFRSEFVEGAATEQFVYRVSSGKPALMGYNISSPILIIR